MWRSSLLTASLLANSVVEVRYSGVMRRIVVGAGWLLERKLV